MPFGLTNHIQAVVIGDNVYVGGVSWSPNGGVVMVYSLSTKSWRTLSPCENEWFGMTAVDNQLVLVGGKVISNDKETNVLSVWDEPSQSWTHPFPEMPTSRYLLSVVSYHKWLVVAGGSSGGPYLNKVTVELLDTLSGQWYKGSPLPSGGCSEMTSAISGNMWYLAGGFTGSLANRQAFSVCLDELISQAVSQSAVTNSPSTPSPWQTLTDTPLIYSTVSVLNGALLSVGGPTSSAIHHYQPSSRSWVNVGNLSTKKRWRCACTVLPNGEIFIAGGCGPENSRRLDTGAVTF